VSLLVLFVGAANAQAKPAPKEKTPSITAYDYRWTTFQNGFADVSFAVRNRTTKDVTKVTFRLIFYDGNGEPIHYEDCYEGLIPAGLAVQPTVSLQTYAKNSKPKSYRWIELVWRVHLEPFFGGLVAERVNGDHLQRYIRERLDVEAAPSTVNHELTVFKAMFNHGVRADPPKVLRVPRFPAKLREANPRSGFVNDEQYETLQSKARYDWLRAVLAVAYNFGLRKGELLGLRVSQIDLKARTIRLLPGTTKSDKGRAVVMTEDVYKLVAECVKDKKSADPVLRGPMERQSRIFERRGAHWRRRQICRI
jgi:integrase